MNNRYVKKKKKTHAAVVTPQSLCRFFYDITESSLCDWQLPTKKHDWTIAVIVVLLYLLSANAQLTQW